MTEEQKTILQRDIIKMLESCAKLMDCLHNDKPCSFWMGQLLTDSERIAEYRKVWLEWK